jgi:hypothetical protein
MQALGSMQGYRVVSDPTMLKIKFRKEERKWSHRKRWKPERRFNFIPYQVPSDEILILGNNLVAHPAQVQRIKDAIDKQSHTNYSIGMQL